MGVESIWEATVHEVPYELIEQTNDFQTVIDTCKNYAHKHGIKYSSVLRDLKHVIGYED